MNFRIICIFCFCRAQTLAWYTWIFFFLLFLFLLFLMMTIVFKHTRQRKTCLFRLNKNEKYNVPKHKLWGNDHNFFLFLFWKVFVFFLFAPSMCIHIAQLTPLEFGNFLCVCRETFWCNFFFHLIFCIFFFINWFLFWYLFAFLFHFNFLYVPAAALTTHTPLFFTSLCKIIIVVAFVVLVLKHLQFVNCLRQKIHDETKIRVTHVRHTSKRSKIPTKDKWFFFFRLLFIYVFFLDSDF